MFLKLQNNIYQNEGLFWCILQTPPKKWRRILTYILATQVLFTRVHKIVKNFFPNEKLLLLLRLLHLDDNDDIVYSLSLTLISNRSQTEDVQENPVMKVG